MKKLTLILTALALTFGFAVHAQAKPPGPSYGIVHSNFAACELKTSLEPHWIEANAVLGIWLERSVAVPFNPLFEVKLIVDGNVVDEADFPMPLAPPPVPNMFVSFKYELTPGTHHVVFTGEGFYGSESSRTPFPGYRFWIEKVFVVAP